MAPPQAQTLAELCEEVDAIAAAQDKTLLARHDTGNPDCSIILVCICIPLLPPPPLCSLPPSRASQGAPFAAQPSAFTCVVCP